MNRSEQIFANIGRDQTAHPPVVNHGDPELAKTGQRYKLTKANIIKALAQMPDEAALWSPDGFSEYDSKQAMREALWTMVEKKVQTFQYAPDGKTLLEVK